MISYAKTSVGLTDGSDAGREVIKWFAEIESRLHKKCLEVPHAENILGINGMDGNIVAGIVAEMGDVSGFDDVMEIQKQSGMSLAVCSSGRHKGQTKISHRGRKRLRYWQP